MEDTVPPAGDAELLALQRELTDLQEHLQRWVANAMRIVTARSQQLADVAERLDGLAREARAIVPPSAAPAPTTSAPTSAAGDGQIVLPPDRVLSADFPTEQVLDDLWQTMQPFAVQRLERLEQARDAARNGELGEEQRASAVEAGRQLMGSLGGYGKLEGSAAADRAVALLSAGEIDVDALDAALHDLDVSIRAGHRAETGR